MRVVDGSIGEGGGQVFRTALTLSLVTGEALRLTRIRSGRERPGLLRQHRTALTAAARISSAEVTGASLGSTEVTFRPGAVQAGEYTFDVGSAGSAALVLQTVLPALMRTGGESVVTVEGGTHNQAAPPFEFLDRAWGPLLRRMGWQVDFSLERHGFYPAGGGRIVARVAPARAGAALELLDRGELIRKQAVALVASLPPHVAAREIATLCEALGWQSAVGRQQAVAGSRGPGNALLVELEFTHLTEIFTSFGKKGVPAERVAKEAAEHVRRYLGSTAPVGEWLADQLLVPMALLGAGAIRTLRPSSHCRTQLQLIPQFLDVGFRTTERGPDDVVLEVNAG